NLIPTLPSRRVFWVYSTVVLLILLSVTAVGFTFLYRSLEEPRVVQFFMGPPEKASFASGNGLEITSTCISPDGRRLAFTARDASGKILLWVRPLDTVTPQSFAGTEGAFLPFWSPDSRSIAFFAQGKLKKIDIAGGPPQTLANASNGRGGTWNRDNVIVFAPSNNVGLYRVTSAGGEPVAVTQLTEGQYNHRAPSFLPDGHYFLYYGTDNAASGNPNSSASTLGHWGQKDRSV